VVGHLVDHLAVGAAKPEVVAEEVAVAKDVRHHDLLVDELVALEQVGVAGVGVDDHLVDLREAVLMGAGQALVLHAEAPVGVARGKAPIGRQLVHLVEVDHLEAGLEGPQAVVSGHRLDFFPPDVQLGGQGTDL
jgi:hypothetical protein